MWNGQSGIEHGWSPLAQDTQSILAYRSRVETASGPLDVGSWGAKEKGFTAAGLSRAYNPTDLALHWGLGNSEAYVMAFALAPHKMNLRNSSGAVRSTGHRQQQPSDNLVSSYFVGHLAGHVLCGVLFQPFSVVWGTLIATPREASSDWGWKLAFQSVREHPHRRLYDGLLARIVHTFSTDMLSQTFQHLIRKTLRISPPPVSTPTSNLPVQFLHANHLRRLKSALISKCVSAVSDFFAGLITSPFHVARVRLETQGIHSPTLWPWYSFYGVLHHIYNKEGAAALWAGVDQYSLAALSKFLWIAGIHGGLLLLFKYVLTPAVIYRHPYLLSYITESG